MTLNGLGRGLVVGYWSDDDGVGHRWGGVEVKLDNAPDWHRKNRTDGIARVFGTEIAAIVAVAQAPKATKANYLAAVVNGEVLAIRKTDRPYRFASIRYTRQIAASYHFEQASAGTKVDRSRELAERHGYPVVAFVVPVVPCNRKGELIG